MAADQVPQWAVGPHYGPVLTPTDLYILGTPLELHPILANADNGFHLLFNIATGQTGGFNMADRNRDLPFAQKDQPATMPRMTEIIIITRHSPWCTIVKNERGVTLADVCTVLWREYVDNTITEAEYESLPPRWQEHVRRYSASNQASLGGGAMYNQQQRLRRCDWLRDKTWFDMLYIDDKYVKERLGFHAANIFVMALTT